MHCGRAAGCCPWPFGPTNQPCLPSAQATLDTNIGAAIGSALGAHLPVTDANFSDFALTEKAFTYSISEGVIVDCSLQVQHELAG